MLNAKSVWYQFTDIRSRWQPLSFSPIPDEYSSELPFLLFAPILGPLPTNLFTARLPYVLINTVLVVFLYLLAKKLFNPKIAFFASLVAIFSPWGFYVSRTSFDAPVALTFFVVSLYFIVSFRGWKLLWSVLPLSLAFYSYIGTKVIFLPFVAICLLYCWFHLHRRPRIWPYLIVFFVSSLLLIRYLNGSTGARLAEMNNPFVTHQSTQFVTLFTQKYLNNFSPNVLFLKGDDTFHVSLWKHGYLYLIEIPLIFGGLVYLFNHRRPLFYLLISLILIAPLPEALRADPIPSYAFHSVLQYPFLYLLIACGLSAVPIVVSAPLYLLSFSAFFYLYFFRYPLYQPEGFNFSSRVVINYLARIQRPAYIITPEPESLFRQYLFYTNNYTRTNYGEIRSQHLRHDGLMQVDGLTFTRDNQTSLIPQDAIVVVDHTQHLTPELNKTITTTIPRLSDELSLYHLTNDPLCVSAASPGPVSYSPWQLAVGTLTDAEFCRLYFRRYIK